VIPLTNTATLTPLSTLLPPSPTTEKPSATLIPPQQGAPVVIQAP
jgi:hypothetical protein